MDILILDVYPKTSYRISKDQNGAYGTANNYGDGFVSRILKYLVKNSIDFPPLYSVQTCGELINSGHKVSFSKELNLEKKYDLYILPSSIVCHETEIEYVKILKNNNKKVIVIGPFVTSNPEPYLKAGATIIKGEPEMFFHKFDKTVSDLEKLPNIIENFPTFSLDELSFPGWEVIFKNYTPIMKFLGPGPAVNINASRGCPYSCFYYCVYPLQQGRKLRLKSPKRLLEEMIHFNKTLNVSNFLFRDPVFSIDRRHTVEICNEKATQIAEKVNLEEGVTIGRTSLKVRNPNNEPNDWEKRMLEEFELRKANGEALKSINASQYDGDVFSYMKPIPMMGMCASCHGSNIPKPLYTHIQKFYPDDKATGFQSGDIRGAFIVQIAAEK